MRPRSKVRALPGRAEARRKLRAAGEHDADSPMPEPARRREPPPGFEGTWTPPPVYRVFRSITGRKKWNGPAMTTKPEKPVLPRKLVERLRARLRKGFAKDAGKQLDEKGQRDLALLNKKPH